MELHFHSMSAWEPQDIFTQHIPFILQNVLRTGVSLNENNNLRFFWKLETKAKQAAGPRVPEHAAPHAIPGTREQSAAPDSHSLVGRGDTGRVQVRGRYSNSL